MQIEPPSLAAKLEREGPLSWREAAGLTAEIARLLDRLHASGKVHGGIEPLAVLFVGGAVRLADPLPSGTGGRGREGPSAAIEASATNGRQRDFSSLGRTFALMLGGTGQFDALPTAMRAVLAQCGATDPARAFRSGNEIAESLELMLSSGEARNEASRPKGPASDDRKAESAETEAPAMASIPASRRRRPRVGHRSMLVVLGGLLLLGAVTIYLMRPVPQSPIPVGQENSESKVSPQESVEDNEALEELLAALPDQPIPEESDQPTADALLRQILVNSDDRPCQRLEVEQFGPDLRLVGRTASSTDRASIMATLDVLEEAVDAVIDVDESGRFCRLYQILNRRTAIAMPRLANLYPRRADHRLTYGEQLMIQVHTPSDPSHLTVDYFTADGMVVHLRLADTGKSRLPPFTEVVVGNLLDGSALRIGAPPGNELILVLAYATPPFSASRLPTETADTYLDALDAALGHAPTRPFASTLAIVTVPATP